MTSVQSLHRLAAVPVVCLAIGLAGCVPGPRPNGAVVELGQQALAAAQSGELPGAQEMAQVFFTEAERLCGEPLPRSCVVNREPAAEPLTWPALAHAVDDVPEASAELVADQAVTAKAALGPVELPSDDELLAIDRNRLAESDVQALADVLSWEQALRYGLTAAAAWTEVAADLVVASDARATMLSELLAGDPAAPAAAVGYDFQVSTEELVDRAAEETAKKWESAAAGIRDDQLREIVLAGAAHARTT